MAAFVCVYRNFKREPYLGSIPCVLVLSTDLGVAMFVVMIWKSVKQSKSVTPSGNDDFQHLDHLIRGQFLFEFSLWGIDGT